MVNMPLCQLFWNMLQETNSMWVNICKIKKSFISLNIKYLVFVVYSIEYRLKRICKSYFYLRFTQRPNFIGIGVVYDYCEICKSLYYLILWHTMTNKFCFGVCRALCWYSNIVMYLYIVKYNKVHMQIVLYYDCWWGLEPFRWHWLRLHAGA